MKVHSCWRRSTYFLLLWAAWLVGCSQSSDSKIVTRFPLPETRVRVSTDSLVVLYYRSTDCFTCFGVLGYWIQVATNQHVRVWLAFDDHPSGATERQIRKLSLPFAIGWASDKDRHHLRPSNSVKEVLFIGASPIDSTIITLGSTISPLAARILGDHTPL